jgi:ABC-type bacteriocin/lantibiotic exporter with double-glycine peptidase domain
MFLQYWRAHGVELALDQVDVAVIHRSLYSPKAHGIFASDMERYLKDAGFKTFALRGEWKDIQHHLSQGRPLILSVQPGGNRSALHYVVATGVERQYEAVLLNDPARGKLLRIGRETFEKEWSATQNWMLLAVPAKDQRR